MRSTGDTLVSQYTYPSANAGTIYGQMVAKNMLSPVIQQVNRLNAKVIQVTKINYSNDASITTGIIQPVNVQTAYSETAPLKTDITYDKYDRRGNVLQCTLGNGSRKSFLWSYNYYFPVAEIENAGYTDVAAALSTDGMTVDNLARLPLGDDTKVNLIRNNPSLSGAHVSTFSYNPFVGLTS